MYTSEFYVAENKVMALCKQPPLFIAWTLHRADRETSYELNHGSPPFGTHM